MAANQIFIVLLVVMAICMFALIAASIKFGLKWANVSCISIWKAFGLWLLFVLFQVPFVIILAVFTATTQKEVNGCAEVALSVFQLFLASTIVVKLVYRVAIAKAARAVLPLAILSIGMPLFAIGVIRPFVYEAFVIPTNSMAPTLLGVHVAATCPRCGAAAFGSPPDPNSSASPPETLAICSQEHQSVLVANPSPQVQEGDRILSCKLISPQRWDMITFHSPEDPSVQFAMRVAGLPGEELAIREGAIWIDGKKIDPPDSLRGIEYSPDIAPPAGMAQGRGETPIKLEHDEYFVLGDFPDRAYDSRFWKKGARGHLPYAVPKSSVTGVVINTYWPLNRWKSFR